MSKQLTFTRLLYPKDEVIQSIWYCFENKTSYKECLFWCCELYMSGFEKETMELLYLLYFCFISFHNKELLLEINKLYKEWSLETDSKEKYVHDILNLLYNENYSNLVYNFVKDYLNYVPDKFILYRGKKPDWLQDYDKDSHSFLQSLYKQNKTNLFFILKKKNQKDIEKIELVLNQYMNTKNLEYLYTENVLHNEIIILCNVYRLLDNLHVEKKVTNTKDFSSFKKEDITLLDYTSTFDEYYPSKVYKILREKRIYNTRKNHIDQTVLSLQNTGKTWQQCYYDDWLYYASSSPLWEKRIQEYDGVIDHKNQKVDFDDSEIYQNDNTRFEEFYNHYNLEPDEQPIVYVEGVNG